MRKTTAIYARYSSHAQDGGTSIEVQLDACRRDLPPRGYREYVDRARTGRVMAGREELLRLLAEAEAGQIERLLVYKYDRLGRNLAETSAIIAQLEDTGVEVVSVTEGKDALARGMHLVISEHYSRVLAERTRDGLIKRFEQKAWTGGPPPYGYRIEQTADDLHRLAINEDEAAILRWVFQVYTTESVGLKALAQRLARRGVPTRRCPTWTHTSVRRILTNDICVGRIIYNRRKYKINKRTGKRVPVWRDDSEHLVQTEERLRIIDDETFAEVQNRLALHARPRRDNGQLLAPAYRPFTGLIFCEVCGSVCYRRTSRNRKGEYNYYECGCRQRNGADACRNTGSVREDVLLERIKRTYQEVFADADSLIEDAIEEARKLTRTNRGELARVRANIGELDKKIGSMTRLLVDPDIDAKAKRAVSRQVGELEAERERLQQAVADLADNANDNTARLAAAVRQALTEAQESLAAVATPTEMRDFIEQYVGPMVLKPNGQIARKPIAPGDAEAVKRSIAGAGLEPTDIAALSLMLLTICLKLCLIRAGQNGVSAHDKATWTQPEKLPNNVGRDNRRALPAGKRALLSRGAE
ncbi:MAG TPA: recombinase family protein [Phycisphaerae bacterium]|nr:recombinase family protein [Phycisphaerae bacterium]